MHVMVYLNGPSGRPGAGPKGLPWSTTGAAVFWGATVSTRDFGGAVGAGGAARPVGVVLGPWGTPAGLPGRTPPPGRMICPLASRGTREKSPLILKRGSVSPVIAGSPSVGANHFTLFRASLASCGMIPSARIMSQATMGAMAGLVL